MAMALVDGRISAQEVEVQLTLRVPHMCALSLVKNDGQGMVVVGGVFVFPFNGLLGGEGSFGHWCCGSVLLWCLVV
ncbi:hypothetical protein P301_L31851 [Saccharomyces cerevisiae P301]|nr:hypothetical protein R008_L13196 [Saccharomyces cerevisiae R008]EWG89777.1 hypothetical protein P301_L31851 [Saccharomyces cerevisiae P301]EWG94560.1 hypothetical protein R103_L31826 [Saccharomyces cerevisiae R103]